MHVAARSASVTCSSGEVSELLQPDRANLTLTDVSGDALATWLEEVRVGARARPLEASLQQVSLGRYSGTLVLALASAASNR